MLINLFSFHFRHAFFTMFSCSPSFSRWGPASKSSPQNHLRETATGHRGHGKFLCAHVRDEFNSVPIYRRPIIPKSRWWILSRTSQSFEMKQANLLLWRWDWYLVRKNLKWNWYVNSICLLFFILQSLYVLKWLFRF